MIWKTIMEALGVEYGWGPVYRMYEHIIIKQLVGLRKYVKDLKYDDFKRLYRQSIYFYRKTMMLDEFIRYFKMRVNYVPFESSIDMTFISKIDGDSKIMLEGDE